MYVQVSMGLPANGGMGGPEPEWQETVAKYMEITAKHNKPRGGIAIGPDEAFSTMVENLDLIIGSAEIIALATLQQDLQRIRDMSKHKVKNAQKEIPVANGQS